MPLREELSDAGFTFDGHVTNGSLEAQVAVFKRHLQEFVQQVKSELKTAGDFGKFDDNECYGEYIAIEILKRAEEKWLL